MAYLRTRRVSAGGGGGQTLAWAMDAFAETDPFGSPGPDLTLNLSHTPVDPDAITVWSQGQPLHPDDWDYAAGVITILFSADPAMDTDTGTWNFLVQYPYAT